nr:glycosyltransferase [Cytophagales bacterium]
MANVFLFPLNQSSKGSPNPYMTNFKNALKRKVTIVNEKAVHRGVLTLFFYLFRSDFFILNWIEFLSEKRFGIIQYRLFVVFCWISKILQKKIVWVLHNKGSHHGGSSSKTAYMFDILMNRADHIITHSYSGKEFVEKNYPAAVHKVEVIIHPVEPPFEDDFSKQKTYDMLIWGSLHPYKGVDRFLEFIRSSSEFDRFKMLIVGKCFNESYKEKIEAYLSDNITYRDEMLTIEDIAALAARTRFVLFTYKSETILSSGALMDTMRMDTQVLGPDYAAFKDLSSLSCITTYRTFEELPSIIKAYDETKTWNQEMRERFYKENNWNSFADKLFDYFLNG